MKEQHEEFLKKLAMLCTDYNIDIVSEIDGDTLKITNKESLIYLGSISDLKQKYTLSSL